MLAATNEQIGTPSPDSFDTQPAARRVRLGRYELIERIGKGGCGTVFRCEDADGKTLAIKVLSSKFEGDERFLVRFYQEAKLAMRLESPHLMSAHEVGYSRGRHFYAMDYAEKGDVHRHVTKNGPLTEGEALKMARDMAEGLRTAHAQKLLHRDIKPSNVLIMSDGRAVLSDWGFAKEHSVDLNLTMDAQGLGTPQFIAPEQFRDAKNATRRADVYGLGATLYFMLTGCPPFHGGTNAQRLIAKCKNEFTPVQSLNPTLHRSTVELIRMTMEGDPRKRVSSVERLIKLLDFCIAKVDRRDVEASSERVWEIVFINAAGKATRTKASTSTIKRMILSDQLGLDARVADGVDYVPIWKVREFHALFSTPNHAANAIGLREQLSKLRGPSNRLVSEWVGALTHMGHEFIQFARTPGVLQFFLIGLILLAMFALLT